jgi:hypothetical protein
MVTREGVERRGGGKNQVVGERLGSFTCNSRAKRILLVLNGAPACLTTPVAAREQSQEAPWASAIRRRADRRIRTAGGREARRAGAVLCSGDVRAGRGSRPTFTVASALQPQRAVLTSADCEDDGQDRSGKAIDGVGRTCSGGRACWRVCAAAGCWIEGCVGGSPGQFVRKNRVCGDSRRISDKEARRTAGNCSGRRCQGRAMCCTPLALTPLRCQRIAAALVVIFSRRCQDSPPRARSGGQPA